MRDIRESKRWLVWLKKDQPKSALTGKHKRWSKNLSSYTEAAEYCKQNPGYNLGYCFSPDCGFVGLDLDGCRNPETGRLEDWAFDTFELPCWANVSTSGTGIKMICAVDRPLKRGVRKIDGATQFGDHDPQVELFTSKYFALTVPELTDEDAESIELLADRYFDELSDLLGYDVTDGGKSSSSSNPGSTNAEELRDLLSRLSIENYSAREDWLRIMQAANHATAGSEEGKQVFREWSEGDLDKFDEADFNRDWESLDPDYDGGITIATIIKEINPADRPKPDPEDDFGPAVIAPPKVETSIGLECLDNQNEAYIADLFVERSRDSLKYVPAWSKWLYWDGTRWVVDPDGGRALWSISRFVKTLFHECPREGKEAKQIIGFVNSLNNAARMSNIARIAKSNPDMFVDHRDLDANMDILNLQNCTVELETGLIRDHNQDDLCTMIAAVEHIENAECPTWLRVLNDIFEGDEDLIRYVQKLLGYCLSGRTHEEIFPVAYGNGCNGKSTITSQIMAILGDYSVTVTSSLFDAKHDLHPTHVASLFRKRFVAVSEMEEDVTLSEAMVKQVTSQDQIEARRMREDPWQFQPTHTSWLSTNHRPRVRGTDKGIWRRIKLIPFDVDLTDQKDVTIPRQLESERSGILNWLLEGYQLYRKESLHPEPEAVTLAIEEYQSDQDSFGEFIEEELVEGEACLARDVFDAYRNWGGKLGRTKFRDAMKSHGIEYRKWRDRGPMRDKHVYVGVRIKGHSDFSGE